MALSGVYIPKTCYGDAVPLSNMSSISKNRAWRDLQWDIQANTDPGGRKQYKMERMHKDQGSENLGAAKAGLAEDSLVQTEGDRDRHTDNSGVEGWFGRLQRTMACTAIGAWRSEQEFDKATMSTRGLHSADLIKQQPCSKAQRDQDISPIQDQFHPQCYLDAPKHTYGELLFGFIKKDERPNKTGPRAYTAFYAGECRRVKGNIIAHPILSLIHI